MDYFRQAVLAILVVMLAGLAVTLVGGLAPYFLTFQAGSAKGHAGLYYTCDTNDDDDSTSPIVQLCNKWKDQSFGWEVVAKTVIGLTFLSQIISLIMVLKLVRGSPVKPFMYYVIPILSVIRMIFIIVGIAVYAANYKNLGTEYGVKIQLGICFYVVAIGIITNLIAAILGGYIIYAKPKTDNMTTTTINYQANYQNNYPSNYPPNYPNNYPSNYPPNTNVYPQQQYQNN